jgi:hypothetical protein
MPASSAPFVMEDVVREVNMRASRQANIVLTGILPSPPLTDAGIVTNLLRDELGINAIVTCWSRLGRPSANINRPCALLVTLSSEGDARKAIRSAKRLRSSADSHVRNRVFLNADLTPEQRKVDYDLRMELKRRRAADEADLIIRNGRLHTKALRPAAPETLDVATISAARAGP